MLRDKPDKFKPFKLHSSQKAMILNHDGDLDCISDDHFSQHQFPESVPPEESKQISEVEIDQFRVVT